MKILFLSGQYPPNMKGGGEISTHLIARGLDALGHRVHVIAEGPMSEQHIDNVCVHRLPLGLTNKPLFEKKQSQRIAKELNHILLDDHYDVLHAHDFRSALVLYEYKKLNPNARVLVTVRDYAAVSGDTNAFLRNGSIPTNPSSFFSLLASQRIAEAPLMLKLGRALQYILNTSYRRRVFSSLPEQIFISDAQKGYIERTLPASSNVSRTVIYNPIDPEYLKPCSDRKEKLVIYVGRVEKYKGVDLLLDAWPKILAEHPDAMLQIVGEGAQREEYEQEVNRSTFADRVIFRSFQHPNEIIDIYNSARVLVSPHRWLEPFGRTIIEGMARGALIVAAAHGGPAEILERARCGYKFPPNNTEELAASTIAALNASADEVSGQQESGRKWVDGNLRIEHIAKQYEIIYGIPDVASVDRDDIDNKKAKMFP